MSVMLTGLSAAGKSTLCAALAQRLGVETVNFGDLVLRCKECGPRPRLCQTCPADLPRRRACVTGYLKKWYPMDRLLMNGHAIFLGADGEVVFGFSPAELQGLELALMVLVEACPQVLMARRRQDALLRPDRPTLTEAELEEFSRLQRSYVQGLTAQAGIELLIYDNSFDLLEREAAFAELTEAVRACWKEG